MRPIGDANCDMVVDTTDYTIWRNEYTNQAPHEKADFNEKDGVTLVDLEIWVRSIATGRTQPTAGPTAAATVTQAPAASATRTLSPTAPPGCRYEEVQCVQAPCNPQLVCASPTVTGTASNLPDLTVESIVRSTGTNSFFGVIYCNRSNTASRGKFRLKIESSSTGKTYTTPDVDFLLYDVPAPNTCDQSDNLGCDRVTPNCTDAYSVKATADATGTVQESNEENNSFTYNFSITPSVTPSPGPSPTNLTGHTLQDNNFSQLKIRFVNDENTRVENDLSKVSVVYTQPYTWSNGCMGCETAGAMCTSVLTTGYRTVLSAPAITGNNQCVYRAYHYRGGTSTSACAPTSRVATCGTDAIPQLSGGNAAQ
jgi:hypothetical protein